MPVTRARLRAAQRSLEQEAFQRQYSWRFTNRVAQLHTVFAAGCLFDEGTIDEMDARWRLYVSTSHLGL